MKFNTICQNDIFVSAIKLAFLVITVTSLGISQAGASNKTSNGQQIITPHEASLWNYFG